MIRLFSMDMKREVRASYIFWIGWLDDLLMFSQDRKWMVMGGGGEEREREHAVSNADTNDAYFNKTIDLLLVGKKEKEERRKTNRITVTSLLKIFCWSANWSFHRWIIESIERSSIILDDRNLRTIRREKKSAFFNQTKSPTNEILSGFFFLLLSNRTTKKHTYTSDK